MQTSSPAEATAAPQLRERTEIPDRFKWNLAHIFPDWDAWQRTYDALDKKITEYAALEGTLAAGPDKLLAALLLADEIGRFEYLVWYFATLSQVNVVYGSLATAIVVLLSLELGATLLLFGAQVIAEYERAGKKRAAEPPVEEKLRE